MSSSGNRFAPVTPDNHSGSIWIASLLCLVYSTLVLVVRGHLRWKMYGPDDWLAAAATLLQLGEVAAIIVALKNGIGQSLTILSVSERTTASQATFAGQILFILSCCLAKCSTIWLMMRLFNLNGTRSYVDRRSKMLYVVCVAMLGLVGLWGVGSVVALCVSCSSDSFAQRHAMAQCSDLLLRWQLIATFDMLVEALIVLISVFVVWPVQLSLSLKCQVVLAFAFRLPVIALAALHLHYVGDYARSSVPGLALVPVLVLQQIELCWSLVSATIPNIKSFVKHFSSGFGLNIDLDANTRYGSRGYGKDIYELGSRNKGSAIRSHKSQGSVAGCETQVTAATQPDQPSATIREEGSIESHGSQERIIRKDIRWDVRYEDV